MREVISSGAPWEKKVGYTRAVRIENVIEVSGTTSVINSEFVGENDAYLQAYTCLSIIKDAIEGLGGKLSDTVRTKMYVTDISLWEEFGRAHQAFFANHPPASTMVEVSNLIDPKMLIEIEATAIISK